MNNTKLPSKFQAWINARQQFHLSHKHIQMARELGMNPKKLDKLANTKQQPWKAPLSDFIEELYYAKFSKLDPDEVMTIEQIFKAQRQKNNKTEFTPI